MKNEGRNIYSVFDELIPRSDKELMLKQKACVIWMTGLSGAGKTTIAKGLEQALHAKGFYTKLLDGDNTRAGLNNNLGFSAEDRNENIRRVSEVAKLFLENGTVTICTFISPTIAIRKMASEIIGEDNFVEVFVNTSLEECERRDVKGLYKKARKGEIKDFTGISAPFESPAQPQLNLITDGKTVEQSVQEIVEFIISKIQIK